MSKKSISIKSNLTVFLAKDTREKYLDEKSEDLNEEQEKELANARQFFGVDELNQEKEFYLKIEEFLWTLFEQIEEPKSPLRKRAHDRLLQEVASSLEKTIETEELPTIDDKYLAMVVASVEDPEKFKDIHAQFVFTAGEEKRSLPLPAVNVLQDSEFLESIDTVFKGVSSLEA